MNKILSDNYLTSKEKDHKASELKKVIALILNDLVKVNVIVAYNQEKVFSPILI